MDLNRLTEFTVIARQKSIKKAAQELNLSCATLSARLIKFEEYLGTALFERTPGAMVLTDAGQLLLPSALEILSRFQRIGRDVQAAKEHTYHHLRIAVTGSNLPLYLGPFLDQLNLAYPDMELEILDDSCYGITDGIQSGQVDIYFAPVMADYAPRNLAVKTVAASSQYAIMPKNHPLSDKATLSIRQLDGEQFLLYPKTAESAIRDFQTRNLRESGIRYTLYDSSTATLFYKLLVPVGKGILLHPAPMMDLPPNTVSIPVTDLPHPAANRFFYDKLNPAPDVQAFVRDFSAFAGEVVSHEHRSIV